MDKKAKLIIKFKSDVCVSSGYSYAGIIDSDICYDKYGLPYIPAKRLKGCFRDTAKNLLSEYIDGERISKLFGRPGEAQAGSLVIYNAQVKNRDNVVEEIEAVRDRYPDDFGTQRIIEQFSRIIAQTAIEDDVASDTSLRYTRVINHFSPIDGEEMVFEALVKYDSDYEQDLIKIIKATRHIGLKRNRGLGVVSCSLEEYNAPIVSANILNSGSGTVISYKLINEEPLMLGTTSSTHTSDYISGQMVLGLLAGEYLKNTANSADSDEFVSLFLNGDVKYSNAYPCDRDMEYYPCPLYLNRRKKTKELVNLYDNNSLEKNNVSGNQPKKLKGKFVSIEGNKTIEVDKKIYYHHRKNGDAILYSSEAIAPEQLFAGKIYTSDGRKAELIANLLSKAEIHFGKSKGSEYGKCSLVSLTKENIEAKHLTKGEEYIVTLIDDGIFTDELGNCSVEKDVIYKEFKEKLNTIEYANDNDSVLLMDTGLISGYQTMWNLHKPLTKLVKAGSCIRFKATEDVDVDERFFVGERNQEGYGLALVRAMKEISLAESCEAADESITKETHYINGVATRILAEQFVEQLCDTTREALLKELYRLDSSQIGRVTLMLKQKTSFTDFCARINSIKTESFKKVIKKCFVDDFIYKENPSIPNVEQFISKISDTGNKNRVIQLYKAMTSFGADNTINNDVYDEFVLNTLIQCKYKLKEKKYE